jgi:outer membrane protein
MNAARSLSVSMMKAAITLLIGVALVPGLHAQARSLSPEDVIRAALAGDARVESATWDWLAAQAKAREAELRRLPSISLSAGYTRLSDLKSTITLGPVSMTIDSLDNAFALNANLQYPVFAGFRLRESARLAQVQAQGKEIAAEMIKRSLVFEAQRAYWEAQRATYNVGMLRENLAFAAQSQEVVKQQLANGTAMQVDLLSAKARVDQATMDLGAAINVRKRAFWTLASLVEGTAGAGKSDPAGAEPEAVYTLAARPEPVPENRIATLDEAQLIDRALANRPETRASGLVSAAAEIGRKIAEAPLYPTLSLTGSFVFADPNPRVAFQTDPSMFTGTWSLGMLLSYDIGGLPANLAAREAQADSAAKSRADEQRQRETVVLDVKNCLLTFQHARSDYALISGMIDQAKENERVVAQRVATGTANDLDQLSARTARLKMEFMIANKLIDQQIAAADLERAAALSDIR